MRKDHLLTEAKKALQEALNKEVQFFYATKALGFTLENLNNLTEEQDQEIDNYHLSFKEKAELEYLQDELSNKVTEEFLRKHAKNKSNTEIFNMTAWVYKLLSEKLKEIFSQEIIQERESQLIITPPSPHDSTAWVEQFTQPELNKLNAELQQIRKKLTDIYRSCRESIHKKTVDINAPENKWISDLRKYNEADWVNSKIAHLEKNSENLSPSEKLKKIEILGSILYQLEHKPELIAHYIDQLSEHANLDLLECIYCINADDQDALNETGVAFMFQHTLSKQTFYSYFAPMLRDLHQSGLSLFQLCPQDRILNDQEAVIWSRYFNGIEIFFSFLKKGFNPQEHYALFFHVAKSNDPNNLIFAFYELRDAGFDPQLHSTLFDNVGGYNLRRPSELSFGFLKLKKAGFNPEIHSGVYEILAAHSDPRALADIFDNLKNFGLDPKKETHLVVFKNTADHSYPNNVSTSFEILTSNYRFDPKNETHLALFNILSQQKGNPMESAYLFIQLRNAGFEPETHFGLFTKLANETEFNFIERDLERMQTTPKETQERLTLFFKLCEIDKSYFSRNTAPFNHLIRLVFAFQPKYIPALKDYAEEIIRCVQTQTGSASNFGLFGASSPTPTKILIMLLKKLYDTNADNAASQSELSFDDCENYDQALLKLKDFAQLNQLDTNAGVRTFLMLADLGEEILRTPEALVHLSKKL